VRHLRQTVRFGQNVAHLLSKEQPLLLEVGPGNVLSGLARRQGARELFGTLRSAQETGTDEERLSKTLGRLWVSGGRVDWKGRYRGEKRHKVALPTYPFERQRYWIALAVKRASAAIQPTVRQEEKADISDWFHMVSWERSERLAVEQTIALAKRECWLVF